MSRLLEIVAIVLPVFIMGGLGALLDRFFRLKLESVIEAHLYIFLPCLLFTSLYDRPVGAEVIGRMAICYYVLVALLFGVGWLAARAMRLPREMYSPLFLCIFLLNSGNYGFPVNLLAFGQEGLSLAAVFILIASIVTNFFGITMSASRSMSLFRAILEPLKLPSIYAMVAAVLLRGGDVQVPDLIINTTRLLGQAAIPLSTVVVGMQFGRTHPESMSKGVPLAVVLRLIVSPIIAFFITNLLGLTGLPQKVFLIQTAMPTAVLAGIYSARYNNNPGFVSTVLFVSTLVSIVTVSVVLWLVL